MYYKSPIEHNCISGEIPSPYFNHEYDFIPGDEIISGTARFSIDIAILCSGLTAESWKMQRRRKCVTFKIKLFFYSPLRRPPAMQIISEARFIYESRRRTSDGRGQKVTSSPGGVETRVRSCEFNTAPKQRVVVCLHAAIVKIHRHLSSQWQ